MIRYDGMYRLSLGLFIGMKYIVIGNPLGGGD